MCFRWLSRYRNRFLFGIALRNSWRTADGQDEERLLLGDICKLAAQQDGSSGGRSLAGEDLELSDGEMI